VAVSEAIWFAVCLVDSLRRLFGLAGPVFVSVGGRPTPIPEVVSLTEIVGHILGVLRAAVAVLCCCLLESRPSLAG
jgi:hypothetical protein